MVSQLLLSLKNSLSLSPRERKILAIGMLTPVLGALVFAHFKLQLPWYSTLFSWNPDLEKKVIQIKEGNIATNLYKFFYKESVNIKKDKRFDYENLQDDLAIICCTGVGDIPPLVFPAIHQKLFPTNHFYVVSYEDWEKKRLLATSLGQKSEIIATLLALKQINEQKTYTNGYDVQDTYNKIALFGESRGGAVVIQVIRMLERIYQNEEEGISQAVGINSESAAQIIKKLQKRGIILKNPLLSVKTTSKKMFGRFGWWLGKYFAVPVMTGFRYNPFSLPEPIDAVLDWRGLEKEANIQTLFVSAEEDEVLGSEPNDQFFQNLKNANGDQFSWDLVAENSTHIQPPHDKEYERKVWNILSSGNPEEPIGSNDID